MRRTVPTKWARRAQALAVRIAHLNAEAADAMWLGDYRRAARRTRAMGRAVAAMADLLDQVAEVRT